MDLRQYDVAIARWIAIDPITHHSQSTYAAFDNNPVFWADPSGAATGFGGAVEQHTNGLGASEMGETGSDTDDLVDQSRDGITSYKHNGNGIFEETAYSSFDGSNTTQSFPESIDFKNVRSKKEVKKFIAQISEWFGFVNKFGRKLNIHPANIIDFYAESKVEKSFQQEILEFFESVIGGDPDDTTDILLNDGGGNKVRIGYLKHVKDNAGDFNATTVDDEGSIGSNTYRLSIRSNSVSNSVPQAIVYMYFTGRNSKFYDKFKKRIDAYKYVPVKTIPYNKQ